MSLPYNLPRRLDTASSIFGPPWGFRAPANHTLEMVMDPEYWVHALQTTGIEQYHTARVIAEDGSWGADLMFVEIDERRMWAQTRVVQALPVGSNDAEAGADTLAHRKDADGWLVEWGGPVHKWRIISPAGAIATKGLSSRAEAEERLVGMKPARAA